MKGKASYQSISIFSTTRMEGPGNIKKSPKWSGEEIYVERREKPYGITYNSNPSASWMPVARK